MKQHQNKIIAGAAILAVLVIAFFWGSPREEKEKQDIPVMEVVMNDEATEEATASAEETAEGAETPTEEANKTESPTPTTAPATAKPQEGNQTENKHTVTLSIRCHTALGSNRLPSGTREILPQNGMILAPTSVTFEEGESVFDVLLRETKNRHIHFEYTGSSMSQNTYIEGIGNLYEFDCGELSGWTYSVNGSFLGLGASSYKLKDGDVIEWLYTCDMGRDVGNTKGTMQ